MTREPFIKNILKKGKKLSKSCWEVKDGLCRESVDCFPRLSWLRPGYITPYLYLGHLVHVCGPMRDRLYAIGGEVVITSALPHHMPPTAICSDSYPTAPEASRDDK